MWLILGCLKDFVSSDYIRLLDTKTGEIRSVLRKDVMFSEYQCMNISGGLVTTVSCVVCRPRNFILSRGALYYNGYVYQLTDKGYPVFVMDVTERFLVLSSRSGVYKYRDGIVLRVINKVRSVKVGSGALCSMGDYCKENEIYD